MLNNIKNDFDFCTKLVSEESLILIPGIDLFNNIQHLKNLGLP